MEPDRTMTPPRLHRGVRTLLASAPLAAVLLLGACSASGGERSSDSDATTVERPDTSSPDTSAPDGSSPDTSTPGDDDPVPGAELLELRPVLAILPSFGGACDEEVTDAAGVEVPDGGDVLADVRGEICYVVGPAGADGTDLQDAEAALQAQWVVNVEARPSSRAQLNAMFNACFAGGETCPPTSGAPSGSIAVVLYDVVISAPTVNGPDLANESFQIIGDFTEDDARELAVVLNG